MTSPLAGSIAAVYVVVNASVRTGQALALIDSPMLRARLDGAKTDLEMERSAEVNAEAAVSDLQAELSNALSYKLDIEAQLSRADATTMLADHDALDKEGILAFERRDSTDVNEGVESAAEARLDEALQLIDDAERRFEIASDRMQQTKADVERCQVAVTAAEAASARQLVLAPFDGKVTAVNTQIGQSVGPGQGPVLFRIVPSYPK